MVSVIIATDKRAGELKECLLSLTRQSLPPGEIIVAHGGTDRETEETVKEITADNKCGINLTYYNCGPLGAARQRNKGAEKTRGEIIFFLDDDIVCEPDFIKEIIAVFAGDKKNEIGGVSGTIVNQSYVPLSRLNKKLFDLCLAREERKSDYAGKLVGPAVNFLPADKAGREQDVDWLPSCCSAYRKNVFSRQRFNEGFRGYSFAEDVEASRIIKRDFRLVNTTKARCFHKDLGGKTHGNWVEIGKMQVRNRWHLMTDILGKNTLRDKLRFLYYQLYCVISESRLLFKHPEGKYTLLRWWGRFLGMLALTLRHALK